MFQVFLHHIIFFLCVPLSQNVEMFQVFLHHTIFLHENLSVKIEKCFKCFCPHIFFGTIGPPFMAAWDKTLPLGRGGGEGEGEVEGRGGKGRGAHKSQHRQIHFRLLSNLEEFDRF